MVGWLFIGPIVLSPLGLFLDGTGSLRNFVVLSVGFVLMVGGFLAGPVYIRASNHRRTATLLGPILDPALRATIGVESWGLLSEVALKRDLPAGEFVYGTLPVGRTLNNCG
ncbi:MAG: hypothetical protein KDB01_01415 [Planctomycetaceae bacterium]|nr:hypothetical protein [Planctomycetaceae bacterium]